MDLRIRRYKPDDSEDWDHLVNGSWNGTFLHSRRFLSYHGNRFEDFSFIIEDKNKKFLGVFPAAVDPIMTDRIISHPGITYGGIVHNGLRGMEMLHVLEIIANMCEREGMRALRYKAIPYIYHRVPAQDDLYALFRLGAKLYRSDLSATIDLLNRPRPSKGRRTGLKKAERSGIQIETDQSFLESYWIILERNLYEKFGVRPVHSLIEMKDLIVSFPLNISCVVSLYRNNVIGGVILFQDHFIVHTQYVAASNEGYNLSALDIVLEYSISRAKANRSRFFDFGTSNTNEGMVLNEGLYRFKSSYGAGGVIHEFYELLF